MKNSTLELPYIEVSVNFDEVHQWDDLFILILAYAVAVFFLTHLYSENGKPVASTNTIWKPIMIVYNIIMAWFSFSSFLGMTYFILTNKLYTENCSAAKNNPLFDSLVYAFYISKYVEFADTLFLIVKGKKVSWLHWFHHLGAPVAVGTLYSSGFEGAWIFVQFNGFVHTFMYTYYGCAIMKIRLKGKSMITTMQILQFLLGFYIVFWYKNVHCVAQNANMMASWLYQYVYVGIVLCFFLNFYYQNYTTHWKRIPKGPVNWGIMYSKQSHYKHE